MLGTMAHQPMPLGKCRSRRRKREFSSPRHRKDECAGFHRMTES
jgi:hypothetical protein